MPTAALSLVVPWPDCPARDAVARAAALGYRAVQLDATAAELRPRTLDRSARRDLASLLRRLELHFTGLDLFIPPEHFTDPARSDRALAAAHDALEFAAELPGLCGPPPLGLPPGRTVSLALPRDLPPELVTHLTQSAARLGSTLADFSYPSAPARPGTPLTQGLDPAAILLAGQDPVAVLAALPVPPLAVRLSDLAPQGRVVPGSPNSRLDLRAFAAALTMRNPPVAPVFDPKNLPKPPDQAARIALELWNNLTP